MAADAVKQADSRTLGEAAAFHLTSGSAKRVLAQLSPPIDKSDLNPSMPSHELIGSPYLNDKGEPIVMPQDGIYKALGKLADMPEFELSTAIKYTRFLGELATLAPGLVRKAAGQKWVPGLCRAGGVAIEVVGGIYTRQQYDDEDDNTGWWLWAETCLEAAIRAGLSIYLTPWLTGSLLVLVAPILPGATVGCVACVSGFSVSWIVQSSVTLAWPHGRKMVRAASRWVFGWF
ncbi:hypothetical protein EXIGLDRAFT_754692 [Exidia glandulosa HHB12029]|uniref:Uncharacterized protein n=1 Tax=Exidia glandulosa HHB12029 TaxID=1314781 RepID=A0A165CQ16_EXIGL|nr:hypothetical protein EXIGLDRAFT_754692 [Exidia glandulosa HHB12029]